MRTGIILISLLISTSATADVIYRWVDENGLVTYSDVPRPGATALEVTPIQTFSPPPVRESSAKSAADDDSQAGNYESIEIASPAAEETIWNTGGLVSVAVDLQPGLKVGHKILLYLDNQQIAVIPRMASGVQLKDVVRGSHQLRAEVVDENERVLISSPSSTFFYQQTSVSRRPTIPRANP